MSHHKRDVYKIYRITSMIKLNQFQFFTFTPVQKNMAKHGIVIDDTYALKKRFNLNFFYARRRPLHQRRLH